MSDLPEGVTINAMHSDADYSDPEKCFMVAHVSRDGTVVGIDHPCDPSAWPEVKRAHIALRDYINERLERQNKCPFAPSSAALAQTQSGDNPND